MKNIIRNLFGLPNAIKLLFILGFVITIQSCNKKEKILYSATGIINGIEILDILPIQDSLLVISGKDESNVGKIFVFDMVSKSYSTFTTHKVIRDISISKNGLWACGDSMTVLFSADTGKTWNKFASFNYFWEVDRTDLKELYVRNSKLIYGIGTKDLLNGNVYVSNNSITYPFKSNQMQKGVNDMVIVDSTRAFVACYGSIHSFKNDGAVEKIENVGGHNFTGITLSGIQTIVSCTFEGEIYKSSLNDSSWKQVLKSKMAFRYIAGDSYGNVIAVGESNTMYISKDFGENWITIKYNNGRDISCLGVENNIFYLGSKTGAIRYITRKQIEESTMPTE